MSYLLKESADCYQLESVDSFRMEFLLMFKRDKFSIKSKKWNNLVGFMPCLALIFCKDLPQQILTENQRGENLHRLKYNMTFLIHIVSSQK